MNEALRIVDYSPSIQRELVEMWRASFERGVGIVDPHPIEEQIEYFETTVLPSNRVRVVVDGDDCVLGFLASSPDVVSQLYVHVDHQNLGIGSTLLEIAKRESTGRLRLFTFARNTVACRFYLKHGFREVARGFEEAWQLEDVEYEWMRE